MCKIHSIENIIVCVRICVRQAHVMSAYMYALTSILIKRCIHDES